MGDYMGRVKENLEDHFGITFFNVASFSAFCEKKKSQQHQQRIDLNFPDFKKN
jgi:hypothetical protein